MNTPIRSTPELSPDLRGRECRQVLGCSALGTSGSLALQLACPNRRVEVRDIR